jgi:membrane protein YqaA with SNARE-associated domain
LRKPSEASQLVTVAGTSQSVTTWSAAVGPSEEQLRGYVRRSLVQAGVGLVLLLLALGVIGIVWQAELLAAAAWVHGWLGLGGLALLLIAADALMSPIPPDVVLLVISKTDLAGAWLWLVPAAGVLSVMAGSVGWMLGRGLGRTNSVLIRWMRSRTMNRALVTRYGGWAVAIGALTPIPFSITCWLAGMCHMPYRAFAPISLLRIPRFVVYYLAIAHADALVRLLF